MASERFFWYPLGMAKRGPKPRSRDERMSAPVLVRLTPAQRAQVSTEAKAAGFQSVAAYLRAQANLEPVAGMSKD